VFLRLDEALLEARLFLLELVHLVFDLIQDQLFFLSLPGNLPHQDSVDQLTTPDNRDNACKNSTKLNTYHTLLFFIALTRKGRLL